MNPGPSQTIEGPGGNAADAAPFIGRYTSGAIATTGEIEHLEDRCQTSDCLLLLLEDGESAIDALVRRAINDRESWADSHWNFHGLG